ncbi:AI-2E family transporter [Paenibacillus physcomitrellae]|uniref:Sporulation integral membrane protein YtvI n=1 Tax=Paenibacillus physcomitrellae TaxID=1619311 RepID=A0ABQ1GKA3_9BACL|nr:AI-2E family transporter [Paenibacillus physcomitrellae]GGA45523.1 sporulation integral membrane protein YtvI [Paenibacillus physcomitrellae]
MLPLYKKYWRTIFDIALIVLTVYLVMFLFSKLYQLAAPVFLSFFVFMLIEPFARFLNRRGMKKPFASAISVILFLVVLLGLLFGAGFLIAIRINHIYDNLPSYAALLQNHFRDATIYLQDRLDALPPSVTDKLNGYFADATNLLTKWLKVMLSYLVNTLGSFSSFMANFGIAIILAFFLSMEIKDWRRIAYEKTPKTVKIAFDFLRTHVFRAIGSYLKAQFILMTITFVLVLIGLFILGAGNAVTMALICAVFDILPLLGVSTILVPWIIYLFIIGNTPLAIGLIVVLAVVLLVRQLLEPKVTGNSIGVSSAYLMLSFAIVSMSLFGVAGLILSPILLILIKELMQQGYLQKWIRLPQEEFVVSPFSPGSSEQGEQRAAGENKPQVQGTYSERIRLRRSESKRSNSKQSSQIPADPDRSNDES